MGETGLLRSRLQEADRKLYDRLIQSWEISTRVWLHLVPPKGQSSNSFQHLANDEAHLDQIVLACEAAKVDGLCRPFSAIELYILLASVLFHDLGKAEDRESGNKSNLPHGVVSAERLGVLAPEFGLQDREIIDSIARICEFHEPIPGNLPPLASNTVIEPYGAVREDLLGALLTLADKMDNNYTRMVPVWLAPDTLNSPRYYVRGVHADFETRMLRSVISYATEISGKEHKEVRTHWRNKACGYLAANMKEMDAARKFLKRYGLFIDAWCVDDSDKLYNTNGEQTHEPLFDKGFLIDVANAMWNLATHVFGDNRYSYSDLASVLGEPDIFRLRMAARRISIIADESIWAGETYWEWLAGTPGKGPCYAMHIGKVKDAINQLEAPAASKTSVRTEQPAGRFDLKKVWQELNLRDQSDPVKP